MPTHHFEFYVSFFFYVLVTCSVLWCVVYAILRCGKLPVRLSVCPSLCEHVSSLITLVLYHMIRNTYCLWLPNFQGHMANSKVTQAKKPSETVTFRVFGHFLENAWGNGLKYHMLLYPDHLFIFWSRSVDFTNFGGILTPWNISNVWFPYLMENAWQYNGLKFDMPMYPDYPQNCSGLVTTCWYSSFLTL